jgi:methylated-DNA-protein-cysteine methyltransferase-like protein
MAAYERVYDMVAQIPVGRVATYGQVALLTGSPRGARQVGYALAAAPDELEIPWHRVLNASGQISPRSDSGGGELQRVLLEEEGVVFDESDRVSLARFQWQPAS